MNRSKPHFVWTVVLPGYTGTDAGYKAAVDTAVKAYDTAVLATSAKRLEKTLQLVGTQSFGTSDALVTSRVTRSGAYSTSTGMCAQNEDTYFPYQ